MPDLTPSIDILVGEPYQVTAQLTTTVADSLQATTSLSAGIAEPYTNSASLSSAIADVIETSANLDVSSILNPNLTSPLDVLVAGTYSIVAGASAAIASTSQITGSLDVSSVFSTDLTSQLGVTIAQTNGLTAGLSGLIGGSAAVQASLDIASVVGFQAVSQLDTVIAQNQTQITVMEALVGLERTFGTCLSVPVAGTNQKTATLDAAIGCPDPAILLTAEMTALIGITRTTCAVPLDVSIDTGVGVDASLDLLVLARQTTHATLNANVKSPDLRVGASVIYNRNGDEVEALVWIDDAGVLHPEWIESMTAQLLYRGEHDLGTVTFDCTYATGEGNVQVMFIHPAHIDNLSVRFRGVVNNCGEVDFTVAAGTVGTTDSLFSPQVLPGVDNVPPRMEYGNGIVREQQLDPAPEEIDVLDSETDVTLLAIDLLSEQEPVETGTGPLDYQGGGSRLLPSLDNDGSFVLQAAGVLAHAINGYTLIESQGQNLLSNTTFEAPTSATNPVPSGWTLSSSTTVTTIPSLEQVGDVYAAKIRTFGSGPYVGPKRLTFESNSTTPVTAGQPVTWSILARLDVADRTARDIPESVVKIDTLKLMVSFRDGADAEVSQQVATFDPTVLSRDNFVLVQNAIASVPAGIVGVRVSLVLESIEESDDVNLWLMTPQVELAPQASSRMVGTGSVVRFADSLRVPQANNLDIDRGNIKIDFTSNYAGTPAFDSCLLDTRTNGFDGFAIYHLATGGLRFIIASAASSVALDSNPYSFNPGEIHTVEVSWSSSSRAIWVDGDEAITSSAPVALPSQSGESIWLMRTAAGTDRFEGILTALEVSREPHAS